jgi:hypothetical protein
VKVARIRKNPKKARSPVSEYAWILMTMMVILSRRQKRRRNTPTSKEEEEEEVTSEDGDVDVKPTAKIELARKDGD